MNNIKNLFFAALSAAALSVPGTANAALIVDIPSGGSWASAIAGGYITPSQSSDSLTSSGQAFYLSQGVTPEATTAILTPDITVAGQPNTLGMSWDGSNTNPAVLPVAWWNYTFGGAVSAPVDMSTGSSKIMFTLYPPSGVWDVSLELIDVNGNSRGWFWPMPNPDAWGGYTIFVNQGAQGVFSNYFTDPGFDITQVVAIRLDESGRNIDFPVSGPIPGFAWNAWDSLRVEVPEPADFGLFVLGLYTLSLAQRRRSLSVPR